MSNYVQTTSNFFVAHIANDTSMQCLIFQWDVLNFSLKQIAFDFPVLGNHSIFQGIISTVFFLQIFHGLCACFYGLHKNRSFL